MSPEARSARGDERRLSVRTLAIASFASATAALVTSLFWRGGTPIAAAVTPVIVSLVSEMLHRPTAVIAEKLTNERDALPERAGRGLRSSVPDRGRSEPPAPERGSVADRDLEAIRALRRGVPGARSGGPQQPPTRNGVSDVSVYKAPQSRRRMPVKLIAVTAVLAFVIGTAILTVPELLAGRSLGHGDRQFSVLGGNKDKSSGNEKQPAVTETETVPQEEPPPETMTTPAAPETEEARPTAPPAAEPTAPESTTQPTTPTTPTTPAP